ncbi:MAG TPA: hypothetical protein PKL92_01890 [Aquaticitalea sp.]|nr:hypothetical protein [Aquaticitalea sp.]
MKINPLVILVLILTLASSQHGTSQGNVKVDKNGVMRWEKTNAEIHGFGVNYTVPFAHAYRYAKKMHIDPKQAIDNDVYHFKRLGFDLYRVHVWDTQISDAEGNLLENEYLDTFDYLLHKLKQQQINYVITPIAYWGDGWPEPDSETPGFSNKYGKTDCLTNPEAIKAQQQYLFQFLNHVNPYTGVAYKDEPNVIAFEVSNEPRHRGKAKDVTIFVKKMVDAMKKTGTKKPIFYNMSHAVQYMDAYFRGRAHGGTFQWYPTGLGYQRELSGNLLPNVDDYNMPFDTIFKKYHGAKLVYEFDAADVGKSYIYPAMARSFRTAGIQIATHFAYDPTYLAPYNTEYNTHYMNLNYTPSKALALKICSEVFHEIPLYKTFGNYPDNTVFDNFKIEYKHDLAEYNVDEKFFYTNTTTSMPKNEMRLREIAGFGNSTLVEYTGTGAYFLDWIEEGVWRLEVLPDAQWVDNPFGRNSFEKTIGVIKWETHPMTVNLMDLGTDFTIEAINEGNVFNPQTAGTSFSIRPGTYILYKSGIAKKVNANDTFKTHKLKDFYAPETNIDRAWLKHEPINEISEGTPLTVQLQYVAPDMPETVQAIGYSQRGSFCIDLKKIAAYKYEASIPSEYISEGYINYNIVVKTGNDYTTYPAGKNGRPSDWDFYENQTYKVNVVPKTNPIYLFNALEDSDVLVKEWRDNFKLVPTANYNEAEYLMNIEKLFVVDEENRDAAPIYDYSFKHFILDKIQGRAEDLKTKDAIVFYGRALNGKPCKLQIACVLDDGTAYGKVIEIGTETKAYKLSISDLKPVGAVILPRPYPSFLPYYFKPHNTDSFDVSRVESLQFSIGPGISKDELDNPHGIALIRVSLE